jgi:hypothetical protein
MNRLSALVILLLTVAPAPASARKPEDVFAGKIMISDAPYPRAARSEEDYISKVKGQTKERINEHIIDDDSPPDPKSKEKPKEWRVFLAAFFAKPVTDLEVTIKIFDVTSGQRLVETFEQQVVGSSPRAYVSDVRLKRGDGTAGYDPNSKIHMVIESHGHTIAESTFFLIGEPRHYSGKVDMSDDSK